MAYAGQTLENPVSGEKITFIQTAADTDGELLEIQLELSADGAVPGAHIHPEQEERFEVLEGTMTFRMGLKKIVAHAGDVVTVPAGKIHAFKNGGDDDREGQRPGPPGAQHGGAVRDDGRARRGRPHDLQGHAEAARPGALRPPLPARGQGAVPARAGRPRDARPARLDGERARATPSATRRHRELVPAV